MKSVFDTVLMEPEQLKNLFITVSQVGDIMFNVAYSFSNSMVKSVCYAMQNRIVNEIPVSFYRSSL